MTDLDKLRAAKVAGNPLAKLAAEATIAADAHLETAGFIADDDTLDQIELLIWQALKRREDANDMGWIE
jgi:hypothetical protein